MPNDWLHSFHSPSLPSYNFKSMQIWPLLTAFQFAHNLTSCHFLRCIALLAVCMQPQNDKLFFCFPSQNDFFATVACANCNSNNRFSASRSKRNWFERLVLPINWIRRLSEHIPFDCAIETVAQRNIWRNMTFYEFFCSKCTHTPTRICCDINWARI